MNSLLYRPWVAWMLCLGLVLPGGGRAAQVEPTPESPPEAWESSAPEQPPPEEVQEVPGTQDAPRYRLAMDEEAQAEWLEGMRASRGLRILGELGGSVVSAAALGAVAWFSGGLLCDWVTGGRGLGIVTCLFPAYLGAVAGVLLGAPLGVWGAGQLLGGNGAVGMSFGGGALGLGTWILLWSVLGNTVAQFEKGPLLFAAALPVLGLAGCIIGYEVSQRAPRFWAVREGLQPLLAFTPKAAMIGVSGHF